ncbi:MAG: radical SAM protein, partial [Bacteroidetes bacterium]|nr:radical SAM protein [Bacteroidota bacterium]
KGGTQTREQIKSFAARLKKIDIIPEYSFVLGFPSDKEKEVFEAILDEINFIREVKEINPKTEIIIYVYSPVPTENSDLYKEISAQGFKFPEKLEDWVSNDWENFDLRKNPLTPWLKPYMINTIKNFETVLNGYYPTATDTRLTVTKRWIIRKTSWLRYKLKWYRYPYEIKLLLKIWKYRQPEKEGF